MSGIVAIMTPRYVVLAADTQETWGQQKNLQDCKLFETTFGICGFVGHAEAQYRVKELLDHNPDPRAIVNWPTEDWGCFYFTYDGQAFELDSPGIVGFFDNRRVVACGTGEQYILGAVSAYCAAKKIPSVADCSLRRLKTIAHIGISAAIHWDLNCGGQVEILHLSL